MEINNENSRLYIVRCGEVALKGMNKPYFERVLLERVRNAIKDWDNDSHWAGGLMLVRISDKIGKDEAVRRLSKVFGVASVSPAISVEKDMKALGQAAAQYVSQLMEEEDIKTFKVKAKRSDKSFPVQSPEIGAEVGGAILSAVKDIRVDVHNPDLLLFADVRREGAYIYRDKVKGFGGLPLGTNGKGLILMSGGIDSPVAAFMMAKRGM